MSQRFCPRLEHPNPQWERQNWKNLNGEWLFEIDYAQSGEERGLPNAHTLKYAIALPFCPESSLSGVKETDFMPAVWYKKTISFTEEELSSNRVLFHIGAADYETKIWVNGTPCGFPHVGGCTPIDRDITELLTAGDNIITVLCSDEVRDPRQPGGKQSMRHASHGCYYTRTTGIWQTVWYEFVPQNHIVAALLTPDLSNASVSIRAELVGRGTLSATVYYGGKKVGEASKKDLSVTGDLEIKLSEIHPWDVGQGNLYDVVLRFEDDEVKTYFGLRHIELKNGKFYLNGRPVFQRLILDQGFYPDGIWTAPTEEALKKDIEISMSAGFNGARLHQKVFEPRFLYHADRMGYLVWGEYASWGIDHTDIANLSTFLPDWLRAVRRDRNHPSVIGWCPFNETWNYGRRQAWQSNEFLRIVYEETKKTDPTRPCIDTSGNFHVVTDIYDVHDYNQDPENFQANYDRLVTENELYDQVLRGHPNRQKWKGEPVFLSEYGGIGICLPERAKGDRTVAWSYGNAATSYEEFYARYKGLTDALLDNPRMLGFCYTQLTDVEQEQNGLFTYEGRKPKFDVEILRAINSRMAASEME